jgi:hypothetical protein
MSKADTLNHVISALTKEPVTYINAGAIAISMTDVEFYLKCTLYVVSIVASILVSRKYLLEIKKLRDNEADKDKV